jgi:hypothetical protein
MKGLRIFDRFGFSLPTQAKKERSSKVVIDYAEWIFDPVFIGIG